MDTGIKKDALDFILIDLNNIGHEDDIFILAFQAKQVFYIHMLKEKNGRMF